MAIPHTSLYVGSMIAKETFRGWGNWKEPLLYTMAFMECALLPIPLEIFYLPLALQLRTRLVRVTLLSIVFALAGGMAGYGTGYLWRDEVKPLILHHVNPKTYQEAVSGIRETGFSFLIIAGFTPLPFTLVSIAAGVVRYSIFYFLLATFFTRAPRMILLSVLIYYFGDRATKIYEKHKRPVTIAFLVFAGVLLVYQIVFKG